MISAIDELSLSVLRDWMQCACGKELGNGIGRRVFVYDLDPRWVIKIEDKSSSFQNVMEWETWDAAKQRGKEFARWLAPCTAISPSGSVLLQKRTTPIPRGKYPKRMPPFLNDFKRSNYGLYEGRVVCHDYGTSLLLDHGFSLKMKKADWWDAGDGSSFGSSST